MAQVTQQCQDMTAEISAWFIFTTNHRDNDIKLVEIWMAQFSGQTGQASIRHIQEISVSLLGGCSYSVCE